MRCVPSDNFETTAGTSCTGSNGVEEGSTPAGGSGGLHCTGSSTVCYKQDDPWRKWVETFALTGNSNLQTWYDAFAAGFQKLCELGYDDGIKGTLYEIGEGPAVAAKEATTTAKATAEDA